MTDSAAKENKDTSSTLMSLNRELPWSEEGEKGVLSGCLHEPDRLDDIALSPDAFYVEWHRVIFALMLEHRSKGLPVEALALIQALRESGELPKMGGASIIIDLATFIPVGAHFIFYVEQVRGKWLLRRHIAELAAATSRALDHGRGGLDEKVQALFELAESRLRGVSEGIGAGGEMSTVHQIAETMERLNERISKAREFETTGNRDLLTPGLSTGLRSLDGATHGLREKCLWVIAADYGDGKTAMGLQLVAAAIEADETVCYYLTEDSYVDWWTRLFCHMARVDLKRMLNGQLDHAEVLKVQRIAAGLQSRGDKIRLRHLPEVTDNALISDMRKEQRVNNTRLFVVDYIQKVTITGRYEREEQGISRLMQSIGGVTARKCSRSTTVVLSQVSETGKLAGARAIAAEASVVFRLQAPILEGAKIDPKKPETAPRDYSKRNLLFTKSRTGDARGSCVKLRFNGAIQRFSDG